MNHPSLPIDLLEHLSEAVAIYDVNRCIVHWNSAAELITGFSRDSVLGRRCSEGILMHIDENACGLCTNGCSLTRAIQQREPIAQDAFLRTRDGDRFPVKIRTVPLCDDHGNLQGIAQIFVESSSAAAARERIRELERLSYLDSLTGLANRRYVDLSLRARAEEFQRYGWPYGVLLLDVDNLKVVNDRWGHEAGDALLRAVGKTLLYGSRPFDVKGRWGGDEFIAVLSNVDAEGVVIAGTRFRDLIAAIEVPFAHARITTSVSVGGALAEPGESTESLLSRADQSLYLSKAGGKNRISLAPSKRTSTAPV